MPLTPEERRRKLMFAADPTHGAASVDVKISTNGPKYFIRLHGPLLTPDGPYTPLVVTDTVASTLSEDDPTARYRHSVTLFSINLLQAFETVFELSVRQHDNVHLIDSTLHNYYKFAILCFLDMSDKDDSAAYLLDILTVGSIIRADPTTTVIETSQSNKVTVRRFDSGALTIDFPNYALSYDDKPETAAYKSNIPALMFINHIRNDLIADRDPCIHMAKSNLQRPQSYHCIAYALQHVSVRDTCERNVVGSFSLCVSPVSPPEYVPSFLLDVTIKSLHHFHDVCQRVVETVQRTTHEKERILSLFQQYNYIPDKTILTPMIESFCTDYHAVYHGTVPPVTVYVDPYAMPRTIQGYTQFSSIPGEPCKSIVLNPRAPTPDGEIHVLCPPGTEIYCYTLTFIHELVHCLYQAVDPTIVVDKEERRVVYGTEDCVLYKAELEVTKQPLEDLRSVAPDCWVYPYFIAYNTIIGEHE